MELFIQTDALTASILEDLVAEKPLAGIDFKITPLYSPTDAGESRRPSNEVDGRQRLNFVDLSTFFVALSVPAIYILKKLADTVLEELGKSLAQLLKESWKRRQKSKQPASPLYVVLEIEEANYILVLDQGKILTVEEILPLALDSAANHWTLTHRQAGADKRAAYSLVIEEKRVVVKGFDPFA